MACLLLLEVLIGFIAEFIALPGTFFVAGGEGLSSFYILSAISLLFKLVLEILTFPTEFKDVSFSYS